MVKTWNNNQQQAFEEILNIGLGRAAVSIGKILQKKVMLAAAGIHISNINTGQAVDMVKRTNGENWVSVSQTIGGDFDAVSLMVFSNEQALNIMRAISDEEHASDFSYDYDPDAYTEIASASLNACLSSIVNMLDLTLESYQPVHHFGDCEMVMLDTPVLPIKVLIPLEMIISNKNMSGFVALSLTSKSLQSMVQHLNLYLESEAYEWVM